MAPSRSIHSIQPCSSFADIIKKIIVKAKINTNEIISQIKWIEYNQGLKTIVIIRSVNVNKNIITAWNVFI